ncbi:hypothetical protein DIPPA_19633 [Diplonema papillatum]|nr:hypothetical protein DIPPA_19633 [Diplonema papillatum]
MPVELLSVMFSTDNALEAIGYKALEDPFQPAGGGKQQQNPFGPAAARRKSDAGTPDQPVADVQVNHSKRYKPTATRNKTGGVAYEI